MPNEKPKADFVPYMPKNGAAANGHAWQAGQMRNIMERFAEERNPGEQTYGWYVGDFLHTDAPYSRQFGFPQAQQLIDEINAHRISQGLPPMEVKVKSVVSKGYVESDSQSAIALNAASYEILCRYVQSREKKRAASPILP